MSSAISEVWHRSAHLAPFDEGTESAAVCDPLASGQAVADLLAKVRQIKTPCTNPFELSAQRWFVESFIDSGFHLRRYEMANAVMQVFGLDHRRSRWLFDTTLVAVRRELINDRRLMPIAPASLVKRGRKV